MGIFGIQYGSMPVSLLLEVNAFGGFCLGCLLVWGFIFKYNFT